METKMETSWYEHHNQIVSFARVLYRCHVISDVSGMITYLEKPWKWDAEHAEFESLGGHLDEPTISLMERRFA